MFLFSLLRPSEVCLIFPKFTLLRYIWQCPIYYLWFSVYPQFITLIPNEKPLYLGVIYQLLRRFRVLNLGVNLIIGFAKLPFSLVRCIFQSPTTFIFPIQEEFYYLPLITFTTIPFTKSIQLYFIRFTFLIEILSYIVLLSRYFPFGRFH